MSVDTAPVAVAVRTGLTVMVTTPDGGLLVFPVEDGQLSSGQELESFVTEKLDVALSGLVGDLRRKLGKTGAKPSNAPLVADFGAVLVRDADAFDEPGVVDLALTGTVTVRGGKAEFSDVAVVEDPAELAEFDLSERLGQSTQWAEWSDKLAARTAEQQLAAEKAAEMAALELAGAQPKRVQVKTKAEVGMDRGKGMSVTGP